MQEIITLSINNSKEFILMNNASTDIDATKLAKNILSNLIFLFRIRPTTKSKIKSKAKFINKITSIYTFISFTKHNINKCFVKKMSKYINN